MSDVDLPVDADPHDRDDTINPAADAHPATTRAQQQVPAGQTSTVRPGLSQERLQQFTEWASTKPLNHPLSFSLRQDFEHPPPPHLIEIYLAVHKALSPNFPHAPRHLLRLMPRDHGKSEAGSVVVPAWCALQNPNIRILILMHRAGKAAGKLKEVKRIIRQNLGLGKTVAGVGEPHRIVRDHESQLTLARTANHDVGTIEIGGFETGHEGGHYDVIILDDIVTLEMQRTEQMRRKAVEKFNNFLHLGDEADTVFLMLGTRKHANDLYGWLAGKQTWQTEIHKAISDFSVVENRAYDLVTSSGTLYPPTQLGQLPPQETLVDVEPHRDVPVLWPNKFGLNDLIHEYLTGSDDADDAGPDADDGDVDAFAGSGVEWRREKQNDPHATEGQILNEAMLNFVAPADYHDENLPDGVRARDCATFIGVDLGIVDDPEEARTKDSDYWALAVVQYDPTTDTAYLTHIARTRGLSVKQGVAWIAKQVQGYDFGRICVESNHAQSFFTQTLNDHGIAAAEVQSTTNKEERIISMSSRFENGKVRIVGDQRAAKWQTLINEWVAFPTGSHDDLLDAVNIALSAQLEWANKPQAQFHFT